MFGYHPTNGERGEILVELKGNFIGFIVNLGEPHQWAAYTRRLELIGDRYGGRAQAATACLHRCSGKPEFPVSELLTVAPE